MEEENELLNIFLLIPTVLPANIYCVSALAHVDSTVPARRSSGGNVETPSPRGAQCLVGMGGTGMGGRHRDRRHSFPRLQRPGTGRTFNHFTHPAGSG